VQKARWAGVILGTTLLLFLALLGAVEWAERLTPDPPDETPPDSEAFRIGVLGDAQKGLANLRNITHAVMLEKVSLLLQTGDLVANNDEGHYRLAVRYLKKGKAFGMPLVSPGNHDLKGGSDRFIAHCNRLEESFTKRDVAIVVLNNAFGIPPEPKHVEERIAAAGPHKAVVLAMHQPPYDLSGTPRPEYATFMSWLEKSGVAYLLCGHVHGYIKKKVGETTVIINGVGGDYDSWQFNQKVYATILDVDDTKISDRAIEIEPVHEVWENIEHLAVGHVAESYRRHPLLCWGASILLAGGVGWGWLRLLSHPKIMATP
jgi:predicted phosphodiesterase